MKKTYRYSLYNPNNSSKIYQGLSINYAAMKHLLVSFVSRVMQINKYKCFNN